MATPVEVIDKATPGTYVEQNTVSSTVMYSRSIEGGTLGTRNCLRLTCQLAGCSTLRRPCADDSEPGEQSLAAVAWLPGSGQELENNSWGYVDVNAQGEEIIYQAHRFPSSMVQVFKHIGETKQVAFGSPLSGWSVTNLNSGHSDRPAFTDGGKWMIWDNSANDFRLVTGGAGSGVGEGMWAIKGDFMYRTTGFANIGGCGQVYIDKFDMSGTTSSLVATETYPDYEWLYAIHYSENFLYATMINFSGSPVTELVQFDLDTLAITNTWNLDVPPAAVNAEGLHVVSDNLIYYTRQTTTEGPLQVWYFNGAPHLLDATVTGGNLDVQGSCQIFPAWKNLHYRTIGNAGYLYYGTDGDTVGNDIIIKIGPIFCGV
jgi:hypothetical protein